MLYAVALSGIPGRIILGVLDALRLQYPDNFVFRGAGAALSANALTTYDSFVIDDALRVAANAVFQKSSRPIGFCRNVNGACALKNAGKNKCGKTDDSTCLLQKPDFLIFFYQEGISEDRLLRSMHHASLTVKLPKSVYNRQDRTVKAIIDRLKLAQPVLGIIQHSLKSTNTPLLLPPQNFGGVDIQNLLQRAVVDGAKVASKQFRQNYFLAVPGSKKKEYHGRNGLKFRLTPTGMKHGIPPITDQNGMAISATFRLGCQYASDFHFDVSPISGAALDGTIRFFCRQNGVSYPKGDHVNISVDDRIF